MRTPAGKLFQYTFGSYQKFSIPLQFFPSSDYALVDSWYDSNTKLVFFVSSSTDANSFHTVAHDVVMVNDESPLAQFQEPYTTLYQGTIELETYL